ncbi:ThiJ/PfpI family protein [Trichophyton tonsurans CBS 112818]|uniref:ThiJ/PfpI family protein n=1 Tax=Trichophyton tonsurans (strain CBS 112818) TaxID=647933 RepID=F2RZY1_TRIT1|nr:ThiJ/PfpI family protein [Trichophyton tonsurans CBS 112818]
MVANDSKTLRIGVLLTHSVQLFDLAAVDLFGMMSKDYIGEVDVLPPDITSLGLPVDINYIGIQPSCAGTFIRCTANIGIRLTASIHDTSVSTDNLDILVIPGPDPKYVPDESVLAFVKAHHDAGNDVLAICTGSYVAGYAGILDHKNVTGPRGLISDLEVKFPNVKMGHHAKSSEGWKCGVTNGNDLVAAYLREHYPLPLVNTILSIADVGGRQIEYE